MRTAKGNAVLLALIDGCRVRLSYDEKHPWKNLDAFFLYRGNPEAGWLIDDSTRKREGLDIEEAWRALKDGCEVEGINGTTYKLQNECCMYRQMSKTQWARGGVLFVESPFRITKLPGESKVKPDPKEELRNLARSIRENMEKIEEGLK